jgi:hypothetical protein
MIRLKKNALSSLSALRVVQITVCLLKSESRRLQTSFASGQI